MADIVESSSPPSSAESNPGNGNVKGGPDTLREDLVECFKSIQSPGTFALFESIKNPPNPGLYLKNGGVIGLPLSD
jgi:hypothetical protein